MRWFRQNRRFGGCLASFALAIQLVLSFGHFHHENSTAGVAIIADAALSGSGTDRADPAHGNSTDERDFCPICAIISLAA
jgi:hypothetical protein